MLHTLAKSEKEMLRKSLEARTPSRQTLSHRLTFMKRSGHGKSMIGVISIVFSASYPPEKANKGAEKVPGGQETP